jgi:DNA-binding NarL/FixJ family response regulator
VVARARDCNDRVVNVLIVDDHASFRRSARTMLERAGHDVVAEAADGASAITKADEHRPDFVLLDIGLPDMSGFEVAARLAELDSAPSIVLVSNRGRADIRTPAQRGGIIGFIPKEEFSPQALAAVLSA